MMSENTNIYVICFGTYNCPLRLKLNNLHSTKSLSCNMGLIARTSDQHKLTCLHILVSDSCAPTPVSICCSFPQSITGTACSKHIKLESIIFITAFFDAHTGITGTSNANTFKQIANRHVRKQMKNVKSLQLTKVTMETASSTLH